jgi:pSer/pThr/pTyr-binding forkhead associated (FHA) protein
MPTLLLQLKNKLLGEYPLEEGASLTIGRRDTNDVVIEDPAVSGHHAKIDALEDRFVLIDLQSKNGRTLSPSASILSSLIIMKKCR